MLNPKSLIRKSSAALRHQWWQLQLAELGGNADIQPTAHFEYASRIRIGNRCRIARQAIVRANTDDPRSICLGDDVSLLEKIRMPDIHTGARVGMGGVQEDLGRSQIEPGAESLFEPGGIGSGKEQEVEPNDDDFLLFVFEVEQPVIAAGTVGDFRPCFFV